MPLVSLEWRDIPIVVFLHVLLFYRGYGHVNSNSDSTTPHIGLHLLQWESHPC
jgi:hypothetical protein